MASAFVPTAAALKRLAFDALIDQHARLLQVSTALPQLALVAERLVMVDTVSQPFGLTLDCLSTSAHFELKALLGEQVSVRLLQPDGAYKAWHGYVTQAMQLGADGGLARYQLLMRPWTSLLALRRDSRLFQDLDAQQIAEAVFAGYSAANFRFDVTDTLRRRSRCTQYRESDLDFVQRLLAEEGLSYHFEHLDGDAATSADDAGHARHVMVIGDRHAQRTSVGDVRFAMQHPTARVEGQKDAITAFMAQRRVQPNAVTLASWDYERLAGTAAQDRSALDIGELPALEVYDGAGAYRYADAAHAERAAALALAALELDYKRFEGQGSARQLRAGALFSLIDHPLYGADRTALDNPDALLAGHRRDDNAFVLLAVEHHATNNLGAQAARLLGSTSLERGSYKNHFHAAPAAAAVVPRHLPKPTAPGLQTALVVGIDGEALTTERDHRVKVQFHWQRGERPNAGGLAAGDDGGTAGAGVPGGGAPGDERSGTWVRVAEPAAGSNWGAVFTPRIGNEVAVGFIEGDIDRPVIVGSLYNGQDRPPFSAGVDSGVNHPGVISGLHSHALDGAGFNQWVVDDASGQLRMRLHCSYTAAEVGLGHLIQQGAATAQRGGWRGSGFEAGTQGWATLRAAKGLLLSSTARASSYGSAQGNQMDSQEPVSQLTAARELGRKLGDAAKAGGAQALASHDEGQAVQKLLDAIDVTKDGKHPGPVNGQPATGAAAGSREGTEPVAAYAKPVVVLDTPSSAVFASEAAIAAYAGQDLSAVSQGDLQQTAAHTYASVSGQTTSLFTHEGGIKVYAANGPVSLRAHTDELQIWADKEVTVVSVNDEIRVNAATKIELIGGQSSVVMEGGDVTFTMPGTFLVKGATHAFLGGESAAANITKLPSDSASITHWVGIHYLDEESGEPVEAADYEIHVDGGPVLSGALDAQGQAEHQGVEHKAVKKVLYKPRKPKPETPHEPLDKLLG